MGSCSFAQTHVLFGDIKIHESSFENVDVHALYHEGSYLRKYDNIQYALNVGVKN